MTSSVNSANLVVRNLAPHAGEAVAPRLGLLVINADDWGRNRATTDRIFDCVRFGSVSAVSAMVFMEDSRRAADLARSSNIDAGLHLNLTAPFTAPNCSRALVDHQQQLVDVLRSGRFSRFIFHPLLRSSFQYVVDAQLHEYQRLYGSSPARIDGHHHIHLCSNVIFQQLLPSGTHVRRNFSFSTGEKGSINRLFRRWQDGRLARRHHLDDLFFSLPPLEPPSRVEQLLSLAANHSVELETHPVNPAEYSFLTSPHFPRLLASVNLPFPLADPRVRYSAVANLAAIADRS